LAADGEEALAQLHAFQPDVITLDINMPGMGGLACLDRIMVERPCPVVMVSSLTAADADATLEAFRLGAVDFVAKPSKVSSLYMDELGAELLGVREVAVVADRELAALVVDRDGLSVLEEGAARGGVAHVADGAATRELPELLLAESVLHQAHGAVGVELLAVARDDPCRLLPAVLEGVQPEVGHVGRLGVTEDAEDAAHLLAKVALPDATRQRVGSC